ncbi:MAG TPA: adenylate/guanylate cyclase domain-containing protein [Kofleriaceae bacterium]|nr:adenylate/guanylate cyclase domain-containing protein [Kofleriaceae bacterium]
MLDAPHRARRCSPQAQHGVTLHLSIGVHSGPDVVGNFGSESRMEYTAFGDTVNIAARLEALARPPRAGATRSSCTR